MDTLGERLVERRKLAKLTQEKLSELVKISVPTINRIENGRSDPKTNELLSLAATLNTSIAYLTGETNDPSPPMTMQVLENLVTGEIVTDIPEAMRESFSCSQPDPRSEVLDELANDPRKFAAAALIAGMNDDQLRKAYDFLHDQQQLEELRKQKGA
jgi:transcriptional regulator with XRE-family HTH domain